MKSHFRLMRVASFSLLLAGVCSSVSCMTTYDVNGRPMQTVDPALAVAGVAAAGLVAYAAANNHHDHYYYGGPGYYGGGYYRPYRRCY
ncbi:MAG: hypothetical protein ABIS50_26165 [Luteolibacter sp.]|uniref:hypothetical protein n=1 Tax=Luteolibacter sp. TaxID=1962973 RepID=UPI003264C710